MRMKKLTERMAKNKAKKIWGELGHIMERHPGDPMRDLRRFCVGYLTGPESTDPAFVVEGSGRTWEVAFAEAKRRRDDAH